VTAILVAHTHEELQVQPGKKVWILPSKGLSLAMHAVCCIMMQAVSLYTAMMTALWCNATLQQCLSSLGNRTNRTTEAVLPCQPEVCGVDLHEAIADAEQQRAVSAANCKGSLELGDGAIWCAGLALGLACVTLTLFYDAVAQCSHCSGPMAQCSTDTTVDIIFEAQQPRAHSSCMMQAGTTAAVTAWLGCIDVAGDTAATGQHHCGELYHLDLVWCVALISLAAAGIVARLGVSVLAELVCYCALAVGLGVLLLAGSVAGIWLSFIDAATTITLLRGDASCSPQQKQAVGIN
jgi:hypothetical protein